MHYCFQASENRMIRLSLKFQEPVNGLRDQAEEGAAPDKDGV
jgi:hypothetical protein